MPSDRDRRVEELLEQYQQRRSGLAELYRKVREISATAVSPRREVSVTVSHTGGVTDVKFTGSAYRRMAPQELSDLVMRTMHEAKERAAEEAAMLIAPILPAGLDARSVVSGQIGTDLLAPADGPRLPRVVREQLHR